ncbi:cation acetate symporter, partial [Mycobacterium sp. ITM-2017-0098]
TSDFLVASRTVGSRWNAAAISGEYLSAASFLGVAGLIAKYGAYTVPDFAEFRLGSVRLRKVAMIVVVVICIFYLVPQYQGAG